MHGAVYVKAVLYTC